MSENNKTAENSVTYVGRNIPYARVWTMQKEVVQPADILDALYARGFMPGLTDVEGKTAPLNEAGLADARFTIGGEGFRIVSLSSSKGGGLQYFGPRIQRRRPPQRSAGAPGGGPSTLRLRADRGRPEQLGS